MLLEGQHFARYHIVDLLSSGGTGQVYLANDEKLHQHVVVKVIQSHHSHYSAARHLQREIQTIAKLDHVHILPVYDSGEECIDGKTLMYTVMPFRHEGSLSDWLHKHSKSRLLPPQDVERIVLQAAAALHHAHKHNITHQNVKPANFLIYGGAENSSQLNLQLADFGVAKFITTRDNRTIRGTPIYMAPEQWEGHPVPETDQYALAIMAYELLTGCPPFVSNDHDKIRKQHRHTQPQPLCSINPLIPREMDAVVLRALSKKPDDRYKSITAFAQAFRFARNKSGKIFFIPTPTEDMFSVTDSSDMLPAVPETKHNNIITLPDRKKPNFTTRAIFLLSLIVSLMIGSFGFFLFARHGQIDNYHTETTATSSTYTTLSNKATAPLANKTAPAQISSTSVAQMNATGQMVATATAYARAVAFETPIIEDPLHDNSQNYNWDTTNLQGGGGCAFVAGAYHASMPQEGFFSPCFAEATNFSNFAYEVQMTIIKGDQGGIAFRANPENGSFYYFHINRSGAYALEIYTDYNSTATLSQGSTLAIKTGLHQPNLLAVVARGTSIELFVNKQMTASVSDTTFTQGQIGVIAESIQNPTDVAFNNAEVWAQ